jgi:hypothetical protein
MRNTVTEFFSHQLNIDPDSFSQCIDALNRITDKKQVLERFYEDDHDKIKRLLSDLGLTYPKAEELYAAIKENIKSLDKAIFKLFKKTIFEASSLELGTILNINEEQTGFFLKEPVAKRLLSENPPRKVLESLGYSSVEKMLEKEDLYEVYAALRFIEDPNWLNSVYLSSYSSLSAEDFEERPVQIRILDRERWVRAEEKFLSKKLHPMTHLKELGVIFIIPTKELHEALHIYLFVMASHYIAEITTYSKYFRHNCQEADFGSKVVSAIRCEVPSAILSKGDPNRWLIIQRYLYKDDPNDIRLGLAHINPEALYHRSASHNFMKISKIIPGLDFKIWDHTNYLAAWFPSSSGEEALVGFNFMDNIMGVMNDKKFEERYSYHLRESLWNKLFINYLGIDKLERTIIDHLLKGWFDIRKV